MIDLAGGRAAISAHSVSIITLLQPLHNPIAAHLLRPHHLHEQPSSKVVLAPNPVLNQLGTMTFKMQAPLLSETLYAESTYHDKSMLQSLTADY